MSNTEAMYTKTCNRCSAMMNRHSSVHCKLWLITKSQISVIVTFYHENDMHRATQSRYTSKKQSRIQVKQASKH